MKSLINIFAVLMTVCHAVTAQMPTTFVETMMQAEEEINELASFDPYADAVASLPIRVINNKNASHIFIQPEVVLNEATLNIIDSYGNPLIAYHFNKLSEIDLSIKRLPAGDYTLNLHSKEGSSSHKVVR